jgi:hypothetical protein
MATDNKGDLTFETPETPKDAQLSFDSPQMQRTFPPSQDLFNRAQKHDFGLGEMSPGVDILYSNAQDGQERNTRSSVLASVKNQEEIDRQAVIAQYIATTPGLDQQSSDRVNFLKSLAVVPSSDPEEQLNTIYEKLYAQKAISSAVTFSEDNKVFNDAFNTDREITHTQMDAAEDAITKGMYAQDLMREAVERYKDIDAFSRVGQFIFANFIPGLTWANTYNANDSGASSLLMGNNIKEQVQNYALLPTEVATKGLREAFEAIWAKNPDDAMYFLSMFQGLDGSAVTQGNIISVLDTLSLASVPSSVFYRSGKALRSAVGRALKTGEITPADIKLAAGDVKGAAVYQALVERPRLTNNIQSHSDLKDMLSSFFDPEQVVFGSGPHNRIATPFAIRLYENIQRRAKSFYDQVIDKPVSIDRLPEDVMNAAVKDTEMGFRAEHPYIEDRILDVKTYQPQDLWGNVGMIGVQLGRVKDVGNSAKIVAEVQDLSTKLNVRGKKLKPNNLASGIKQKRESFPTVNANKTGFKVKEIPLSPDNDVVGVQLGRQDALPFDSVEEATKDADLLGFSDYHVVQLENNKFVIEIPRTIDETSDTVRDALTIHLKNNPTPKTMISSMFDKFRTPKETLHKDLTRSLDTAVMGVSSLQPMITQLMKDVGKLSKASREDMKKFMKSQQMYKKNPEDIPGKYSRDQYEFEQDFFSELGRIPTAQESNAYWAMVNVSDMDLAIRNQVRYKQLVRIGTRDWSFKAGGLEFEGVQGKHLPEGLPVDIAKGDGAVDANVLFLDDATGSAQSGISPHMRSLRNLRHRRSGEERQLNTRKSSVVEDWYDAGYQAIHINDSSRRVIRQQFKDAGFEGADRMSFDYIMVRGGQSKNISLAQIPRRGGGHHIYQDGVFIAQPKLEQMRSGDQIVQSKYYGDHNLWFAKDLKTAEDFVNKFNRARILLRDGEMSALDDFVKKNLPMTTQEFIAKYRAGDTALDVNIPVFARPSGTNLDEHIKLSEHFPNYVAAKDNPHNYYRNSVDFDFAMERGETLDTIIKEGSEEFPTFRFQPTDLVDPAVAINKSARSILRGVYIDDMKLKFAERFVAEFGPYLKASPEQYRRDPIGALLYGEFRDGPSVDRDMLTMASIYRNNARRFFNITSDTDKFTNYTVNKIGRSIFGDKFDAIKNLDIWKESDAIKFTRKAAFHINMGLFNIAQLPLQASGLTVGASIAGPKKAIIGIGSIAPQSWALKNMAHLDHIATKMSKLGWKKEHFIEATQGLERSGILHIGNEVATIDDYFAPKAFDSVAGQTLEAGSWFFRKAEQINRQGSWNMAYLQWRERNPKAVWNDKAISEVLSRAEMLSGNMTAGSNAIWQQGIPSVPTSYWSYNVRLMEMFTGKRLSYAEKGRMFATFGLLWGVPSALGLSPAGIFPLQDFYRQYLLDKGIDVSDSVLQTILSKGVGGWLGDLMTGGEYDWPGRFAPGNFTFLTDLAGQTGDKNVFEWLLGVAGQSVGKTLAATEPFLMSALNVFRPENEQYDITEQDFIDFFNTIGSGRAAVKLWFATQYQQIRLKSGGRTDTSVSEGLLTALTGVTPDRLQDAYATFNNERTRQEAQNLARKDVIKYLRLGAERGAEGDQEGREKYFRRAYNILHISGIPPNRHWDIWKEATSGNLDIVVQAQLKQLKYQMDTEAAAARAALRNSAAKENK